MVIKQGQNYCSPTDLDVSTFLNRKLLRVLFMTVTTGYYKNKSHKAHVKDNMSSTGGTVKLHKIRGCLSDEVRCSERLRCDLFSRALFLKDLIFVKICTHKEKLPQSHDTISVTVVWKSSSKKNKKPFSATSEELLLYKK